MDSGWAAVIGSIVGGVGSFAATWLSAHLNRKRPDPADEAAKTLLRKMLGSEKYPWRKLQSLSNVIGADEATTRRLLLEVGARGDVGQGAVWALVSRRPVDESPEEPPGV
jgi:hypothetical protein